MPRGGRHSRSSQQIYVKVLKLTSRSMPQRSKYKVMNDLEKRALQKLTTAFVESLDPKDYVIDVLYSEERLTQLEYEELIDLRPRAKQCRELLQIVRRKCPLDIFLKALCHKDSYTFLAEQVQCMLRELEEEERREEERSRCVKRELDSDGEEAEEMEGTSVNKRPCPMCKCPPRINTMTRKKKLLTKMQQHLKYLCMDGNASDHNTFLKNLAEKWKGDADVQFVILDARARNMRVSSSEVSESHGSFKDMESLIPFTTDPTTSSMTYLARRASVYDVSGRAEDGLKVLDYAKSHALRVVPCRDTGLVIYMEINLLLKRYEHEPTEDKKNEIVERIKEAIEVHFSQEEHEVREDCSRMLYVKMACFYLGLGLLGNKMAHCQVTSSDLKSAECVLDRLENSWENMDSRRKMFYYLARAVLCQHRDKKEKALHYGEIARQMAEKGQFSRELQNIDPLTRDLAIELKHMRDLKGDAILQEFQLLHDAGEVVRDIPPD